MSSIRRLTLRTGDGRLPYRDPVEGQMPKASLPEPTALKTHPQVKATGKENARIYFIGATTTIIEWHDIRIMTDPHFIHTGGRVHLGSGVTGTPLTNPLLDLHDLPRIDLCLLSHYDAEHFDQEVEASLRRDLPIITTPHAKSALTHKSPDSESFTAVTALDTWDTCLFDLVDITSGPSTLGIKITAAPGKDVPHGLSSAVEGLKDILGMVPPTNGWMLEFGRTDRLLESTSKGGEAKAWYRIFISGDTLTVDDLKTIPAKYPHTDLMLAYLGGTTTHGHSMPLLMLTMDAKQGVQLIHLIQPDVTTHIHYDDYDLFKSSLKDFKDEVKKAGLDSQVVYLNRGEGYSFTVAEKP